MECKKIRNHQAKEEEEGEDEEKWFFIFCTLQLLVIAYPYFSPSADRILAKFSP
jgi:hypothetical protein